MAKKKESKQKKMNVRVDFTPMVDMMMLLITFFMLCTSLSKPQTMQLTMPTNDKNLNEENQNEAKASQTVTLYVTDKDDIVYYGEGLPEYNNPEWLKETSWGVDGIRKALRFHKVEDGTMPLNEIMKERDELEKEKKSLTEEQFENKLSDIRSGELKSGKVPTLTIVIKPTDNAKYTRVIDALDEMLLCTIGTYVIDKINPEEQAMLEKKGVKFDAAANADNAENAEK